MNNPFAFHLMTSVVQFCNCSRGRGRPAHAEGRRRDSSPLSFSPLSKTAPAVVNAYKLSWAGLVDAGVKAQGNPSLLCDGLARHALAAFIERPQVVTLNRRRRILCACRSLVRTRLLCCERLIHLRSRWPSFLSENALCELLLSKLRSYDGVFLSVRKRTAF